MLNYDDMILPKSTRLNETSCNCYICLTGRNKGHPKNRHEVSEIKINAGLLGASKVNAIPKIKSVQEKKPSVLSCGLCKQHIGRGINHKCSIFKSSTNIIDQVETLPARQREQIVSGLLNEFSKEKENKHDIKLCLSTKGANQSVILHPKKASIKTNTFCYGDMDALQERINASNSTMENISGWIRSNLGRNSIETNYQSHIVKHTAGLEEFYKIKHEQFVTSRYEKNEVFEDRPIIYGIAEDLLLRVCQERGFEINNVLVKVYADGGQGFLKLSMSVFPKRSCL